MSIGRNFGIEPVRVFDPIRSGPVRSGPVRSGPVRSGPVRSGPVRSDPIRSDSILVLPTAVFAPFVGFSLCYEFDVFEDR